MQPAIQDTWLCFVHAVLLVVTHDVSLEIQHKSARHFKRAIGCWTNLTPTPLTFLRSDHLEIQHKSARHFKRAIGCWTNLTPTPLTFLRSNHLLVYGFVCAGANISQSDREAETRSHQQLFV